MTNTLTPEQAAELRRLYREFAESTHRAADAISAEGMSSEVFRRAEAEMGEIAKQIRALLGTTGRHWMS